LFKVTIQLRHEFFGLSILLLALGLLIGLGQSNIILSLLRLICSVIVVLVLPGYNLQSLAFPHAGDLEPHERLALSLGISIATLPPMVLFLEGRSSHALTLENILLLQNLLVMGTALASWVRRRGIPVEERFLLRAASSPRAWWHRQPWGNRILYILLLLSLSVAFVSAALNFFIRGPSYFFTEFYVLSDQGRAQEYTSEAAAGDPISFILGVVNREGATQEYRVEVRSGGEILNTSELFSVPDGERHEMALSFALSRIGSSVEVDFLLYQGTNERPYRSLRLWIAVTDPNAP
jgi:uncharacterized membrane protein